MTRPHPKAFAIWFENLERWDVSSYRRIFWHWPDALMVPIGSVLKTRKQKVNRKDYKFEDLQPVTIHFDGSMSKRKMDSNRVYKMELFFAQPLDIVASKIDLKNGAVGVLPEWDNAVFTNHFAIYEPDTTKLEPAYFHLLIQAEFFKSHLWRNKVGAEGRKEVKLDFFESQLIPLPPLETQRAIVRRWQEGQAEVGRLEAEANLAQDKVEAILTGALDLKPAKSESKPKAFAVSWEFIDRWSVSYNLSKLSGTNLESGKFPVLDLGELLDMLQYGTSEKANTQEEGTPILRMNNIQDGLLDLNNIKHIKLSAKERDKLTLEPGDILLNRTNSRELVGKCAVFEAGGEYVFASYCIRVRLKPESANSNYIAVFINSALGREQITALMRPIIGQANINSEEIRSLKIPLPPLETQQDVVQQVQTVRTEAARLRGEATALREKTEDEVERLILGTKSVLELS